MWPIAPRFTLVGSLRQLLERIEDLEPGPFEVPVIPGGDHESVAARCGGDCRLADDVRIEQPIHNFRRFAGARRRGGTSSGLTGHSFMTVSQLSLPTQACFAFLKVVE